MMGWFRFEGIHVAVAPSRRSRMPELASAGERKVIYALSARSCAKIANGTNASNVSASSSAIGADLVASCGYCPVVKDQRLCGLRSRRQSEGEGVVEGIKM